MVLLSWGYLFVCFVDGCKLPSQSSSCHSPHALESSLDSRQHASSRFACNGIEEVHT